MDLENNDNGESSNEEETDGNSSKFPSFMNYENSVFRLKKEAGPDPNDDPAEEEISNEEVERQGKLRALKTERLLEAIRSQTNKMSMWQSFPASDDPRAVVFCYEKEYLKAWMNLKAVSIDENYQLTITDLEIKLKTEGNQNCCKKNIQGVSQTAVVRTYRVPKPIEYQKAVWHQNGNVLEVCVPWTSPLG